MRKQIKVISLKSFWLISHVNFNKTDLTSSWLVCVCVCVCNLWMNQKTVWIDIKIEYFFFVNLDYIKPNNNRSTILCNLEINTGNKSYWFGFLHINTCKHTHTRIIIILFSRNGDKIFVCSCIISLVVESPQ